MLPLDLNRFDKLHRASLALREFIPTFKWTYNNENNTWVGIRVNPNHSERLVLSYALGHMRWTLPSTETSFDGNVVRITMAERAKEIQKAANALNKLWTTLRDHEGPREIGVSRVNTHPQFD